MSIFRLLVSLCTPDSFAAHPYPPIPTPSLTETNSFCSHSPELQEDCSGAWITKELASFTSFSPSKPIARTIWRVWSGQVLERRCTSRLWPHTPLTPPPAAPACITAARSRHCLGLPRHYPAEYPGCISYTWCTSQQVYATRLSSPTTTTIIFFSFSLSLTCAHTHFSIFIPKYKYPKSQYRILCHPTVYLNPPSTTTTIPKRELSFICSLFC